MLALLKKLALLKGNMFCLCLCSILALFVMSVRELTLTLLNMFASSLKGSTFNSCVWPRKDS